LTWRCSPADVSIPALLRVRRELAAGGTLDEQLSVVACRRVAAADDPAPAQLGQDPPRQPQQLADGHLGQRVGDRDGLWIRLFDHRLTIIGG
jgi:hypothetical protein